MAFQLVATPHVIARNAGALYDFAAGNAFMDTLVSQATIDRNIFNDVYINSIGSASTEMVADVLIANLGITGATAIGIAKDYIVSTLDATPLANRGVAVDEMLMLFGQLTDNEVFGAAATAWNAKVQKAVDYAAVPGSVDSTFTAVNAGITEGKTYDLDVTRDTLTGTAFADEFLAYVVQNMNGQQVNTLGTGDKLDGGAGVDVLTAQVTAGAYVNGGNMAIQPTTTSIENVFLEAQYYDLQNDQFFPGAPGAGDDVYVRAVNMTDLEQLWSWNSTGDLIVQDVTSKTASGVVRNTSDMTIGMAYTGNSDSHWDESDYKVYFDQNYLIPRNLNDGAQLFIELMDMDAALTGGNPLEDNPFGRISFLMDGERKVLEFGNGSEGIKTYDALLESVQQALVTAAQTDPDFAQLTAEFGPDFTATDTDDLPGGSTQGRTIVITNSGPEVLTPEAMEATGVQPAGKDFHTGFGAQEPGQERIPVEINVALEKVGDAGDGGDLVIGSMNKDNTDSNTWGAVATHNDTTAGFEKFNVTVYGDDSKPSSLASLRSTNNTLEHVVVQSEARTDGSYADLIIGNSHSGVANANALKDVRTFDASAFQGDLSLTAGLTEEVTAKYMNLKDVQANPSADNISFRYLSGVGKDRIDLNLDADNLAFAGTTTREDFDLVVDTGAGDDRVVQRIVVDSEVDDTLAAADNWYTNSKMNANLAINTGEGNDTVWTPGSGDVVINAGSGNDTVYTDNSGVVAATWVVSALNADVNNLAGNPANNAARFLYDGRLTVTFSAAQLAQAGGITSPDAAALVNGWESTVSIPTGSNYAVTQLHINQAIKDAINNDDVLNKLLEAKDGPGNTLVITSKIDGAFDADDLLIDISAPAIAANNTVAINAYRAFAANSQADSAAASDANAASVTAIEARAGLGVNQVLAVNGTRSNAHTDNVVDLGSGDDVLVMSTSVNSEDTLYVSGPNIGVNTIVNFTVAGAGRDFIDFTSYLTSRSSPSGSSASQRLIDVTLEDASGEGTPTVTFDANEVSVMRFVDAPNETFAGLNATRLQAVINATQTTDATTWGNLQGANLLANDEYDTVSNAAGDPIALVNGAAKAVVMIEKSDNLGKYKVFELSWDGSSSRDQNNATDGQVTVVELGILDFGASLTGLSTANLVDSAAYAGPAGLDGAVEPPPVDVTIVDLQEGTSVAVAGDNAVDELFTFNVAAAQALTDNTQIQINSFDVANDALQIDSTTALGNVTLDALNGVDGIAVQSNAITNVTLINFGADANGDVVTLTLAGIVDPTLVNVTVI